MKKLYIFILALFITIPMFALDITLRVPMSLQQQFVENDETNNNMIYSYGLEIGQDLYLVQVGGGMQWDGTSIEMTEGNSFKNRLMYGYLKFNLFPVVFKPYVVGKIGTGTLTSIEGFNSATTEGGSYTAFGLGIDIFNLQGEMLYSIQDLKLNGTDETLNMLSLIVGIKLF